MADGMVRIVINAIDKYSGVLTGLNQGLELASKAFSVVSSSAILAGDAFVTIGTELAKSANQLEQMRVKFSAVFGEGGPTEAALKWAREFGASTPLTLDQVGDRLIKLKSAGFDPLDDSLGLMTKLGDVSFALGLDFERLLNPLRKLNSGGKATFESINQLAEAGIPIYDIMNKKLGMTADQVQNIAKQNIKGRDIVYQLIDALGEKYTGAMLRASNTAEGALSTISDLFTEVKLAVADAGPWEFVVKQLLKFRDTFAAVVASADFKAYADASGKALTRLFQFFADTATDTFAYIRELIGGSSETFSDFARNAVEKFSAMGTGIAKAWNSVIDIFLSFNIGNVIGNGITAATAAFAGLGYVAGQVVKIAIGEFEKLAMSLRMIAERNPKIAAVFGTSAQELGELEQNLYALGRGFERNIQKPFEDVLSEVGGRLLEFNDEFDDNIRKGLKIDPSAFKSIADAANSAIDSIESAGSASKLDITEKIIPKGSNQKVNEWTEEIDKAGKTITLVGTAAEKVGEAEEKIKKVDDAADKLGKTIKKASETQLALFSEDELKNAAEELFKIDQQLKSFGKDYDPTKSIGGRQTEWFDLNKRADEIREKLQFKMTLTEDLKGGGFLDQVKNYLSAINWPSEFQGLGEFLLSFILLKARGESLPIAVVSSAGGA